MNGTTAVAMCTLALGASLAAQTGPLDTSAAVPAAFFTASESGLQFVLRAQNRDGSWGDEPGAPGDLGNTAWAAMSLLALGHTPTRGQHAFAVRRAVDWLLYHTRGFDVNPPQFRMGTLLQRKLGNNADLYLTCLGYTQLIGMNVDASDDDRMRAELSGMCRAIASLQKPTGDWETSYEPMLTTVLAWLALKQSAAVGVAIQNASPQKVIDYLRRASLEAATGVFKDPHWGNNERFVTQGGGMRVFYGSDLGRSDEMHRARDVVLRMRFDQDVGGRQGGEEFLGAVFATQALFLDGGEPFDQWYQKIGKALLACQNKDGSWTGHHCITGRVFCTAASIMVMRMPDRLLPMCER
jgi:hypothetical protein